MSLFINRYVRRVIALIWLMAIGVTNVYAQSKIPEPSASSPSHWSLDSCMHMTSMDPYGARDYALQWREQAPRWETRFCHAFALKQEDDDENAVSAFLSIDEMARDGKPPVPLSIQVRALREGAELSYLLGKTDRVQHIVGRGLEVDPKDADLHALSVQLLLDKHQDKDAYAVLASCQQEHIASPDLDNLRAQTEIRMGHKEEALGTLNHILAGDHDNLQALLLRGQVWQELGRYGLARLDWKQITLVDPQSHEADMAAQNLILLDSDPDIP